ncbi:hypothetical protein [Ekhidna sp. To15]|uniref:hypothetical protein n=1 Tax=Ekhidna sp. To15 TaxID=3395267 RepID=UPI003F528C68
MKNLILHTVAIILLLAVGSSSLTYDHLLGEKERYEIEDSLEELKEGKPFHDLLYGLNDAHPSEWELLLTEWSLLGNNNCNSSHTLLQQAEGKYILYCNLKLCC